MIDLHCHILPGLDDGAGDMATTLAMGKIAAADGIDTIVATPHVRADYSYPLAEIAPRTASVNEALTSASVGCRVVTGGEVGMARVGQIDDETLATLCLGDGRYLLLESPYSATGDVLERIVFATQMRGFRPVLAHPERSPSFHARPERLEPLVDRGVVCSITGASLAGRFGSKVRDFSLELLSRGLVHNVSSDAHDPRRRPPRLAPALDAIADAYEAADALWQWLSTDVPRAILTDETIPEGPVPRRRRRRRFDLLRRR